MATQRIYSITENGEVLALIKAATAAQARTHYYDNLFKTEVATPEQLIDATKRGINVEVA